MNKLSVIFILLCATSQLLFSQKKTNRLNRQGQKTGKWITYWDSAKTIKSVEGSYRRGKVVGSFNYYTMNGALERKEITRFRRMRTRLYYPDGTLRFSGKARIENLPDKIHYYFYGKWKYYDEEGKILKYCYYEKGNQVKTVYADKNNKTNDSLIGVLNRMDVDFQEKNAALIDSIDLSAFNIPRRERLQTELYMMDTTTFSKLTTILLRYDYPPKAKVHESAIIPFYLLNYAPLGIREQYLPLLTRAADKGDLEWKSLAYYIDKIKVTKGEKQVYGTQTYYKKKEFIPYPSEEPGKLEERRKQVGLE